MVRPVAARASVGHGAGRARHRGSAHASGSGNARRAREGTAGQAGVASVCLSIHGTSSSTFMCGIIGYVGPRQPTPLLIEGLKRMEYRGYDSAGVALYAGEALETRRAAGKIAKLEAAIAAGPIDGMIGMGHTRWATHGPPTERNAHPHLSA